MVLNFKLLGSFTDPTTGERLPVQLPIEILDPSRVGEYVSWEGRCICICERVAGKWKVASFYFVLSPAAMLWK